MTRLGVVSAREDAPLEARVRAAYDRRRQKGVAERYARSAPFELCAMHERELRMMSLLRQAGLDVKDKRILDIGCGAGSTLRLLLEYGAKPENLFGIDLLPDRLEQLHSLNPAISCLRAGATNLPYGDASFDLIIQCTVFTSILDLPSRQAVASEIQRVLAPGGKFLWYDFMFNNPRNPDVRGIKPSEIRQLFTGFKVTGRRITLAPPLGRLIARFSYSLYHVMALLRPLCTHYICVLEKN
jgi:ubiquinone/menaquinone biosynthesis C-methylase UbiE